MIKVNLLRNKSKISCVTITGHARYDDYGKDIVCSAVSTCVITTVNGISLINSKYLEIEQSDNKLVIKIILNDDICNKLIDNMLDIIYDLEKQYPKNIKIMSKED